MAYRSNERFMPGDSAGGRGRGRSDSSSSDSTSSDSSMEDRMRGGGDENVRGIEEESDEEFEETEDLEEGDEDEGSS